MKLIIVHVEIRIVNKEAVTKQSMLLQVAVPLNIKTILLVQAYYPRFKIDAMLFLVILA